MEIFLFMLQWPHEKTRTCVRAEVSSSSVTSSTATSDTTSQRAETHSTDIKVVFVPRRRHKREVSSVRPCRRDQVGEPQLLVLSDVTKGSWWFSPVPLRK